MKRILFYYPSNKRSVQIETELVVLRKSGFDIKILTTCEEGDLHDELKKMDFDITISDLSTKNTILYYFKQLFFLIRFCKKNKIDVVWSNLQHTNFISVFAQFFISAKVICFRHHFHFVYGIKDIKIELNKMEAIFDKIINLLAKVIVVPSSGVFKGMEKYENINTKKLKILPYLYDFSRYQRPNESDVQKIREQYPSKLKLLICSRMIPLKRHQLVFETVHKMIKMGYDLTLFVMDQGPEKENLEHYIKHNNLEKHIIMLGFRNDFMLYMGASDLLIHPSLTDASNNVVKEIGLMQKAVLVCEEVGDFDDYIIDGVNGFKMPILNPESRIEEVIDICYQNKKIIETYGKKLNETITEKFDISNPTVLKQYIDLLNN